MASYLRGLSLNFPRPVPQFSPILIFFKIINYVKKKVFFTVDESVFHSYGCANQTRLSTNMKREINKNRDRFNMAAYGRKPLCRFLHLDLRFRDRMSDPFEKNSTDSQHGFLFVDVFSFTCVYYDPS